MPRPSIRAATHDPAVEGLIRILAGIKFDCACREQLDTALARYSKFSDLRRRKLALSGARERALRISGLLDLLKDLDDLPVSEPDHSVFHEMADLFRDVVVAASEAEMLLRSIAGDVDRL
ncbi:MAG: hypothetical protein O9342_10680 [Beijerinckiaceae bacterium]|nr:hypothetical protein [Beijerinckiaceae bacterium]